MVEDLADILEWHTPDLWKAEDNEEPANEADAGIESESAARGNSLHHG